MSEIELKEPVEITLVGEGVHIIKARSLAEALDLARDAVEPLPFLNHGKMRGAFGDLFKPKAQPTDPFDFGYETALTIQDGDATPTVYNTEAGVVAAGTGAAGVVRRAWEHTVPPRYMKCWGSGLYGAINNQGYAFFVLVDAGTGFQQNIVRLGIQSNDRHRYVTVKEFSDNDAHLADATSLATATPTNNQTKMVALPRLNKVAYALPYSRLVIDLAVIVATTTPDHCAMNFPVTTVSA